MVEIIIATLFIGVIITAGWLIYFYGKVINKKTEVENSWKRIYFQLIYLQLKITTDLMLDYTEAAPNHDGIEKEILNQIKKEQNNFMNAVTTDQIMKSSIEISRASEKLLSKNIQDDQHKYNEFFTQQYHQLKALNQKVQENHKEYHYRVSDYNNFLTVFPNNIANMILGIKPLSCFSWEE